MYALNFHITIGKYLLMAVSSVEIKKSVETLSDTALLKLPAYIGNHPVETKEKLQIGSEVEIRLGYNDDLTTEFKGYLNAVKTDNGTLVLECIDGLYHFKVPMPDEEIKNMSLKQILAKVTAATGKPYTLDCDYDSGYEKLTIYKADCYDILKKIQDDYKANIYFEGNTLHCHAPYSKVANETAVIYDFAVNIEKSELQYVRQSDRKIEVEVVMRKPDGSIEKKTFGTSGGEKKTVVKEGVSSADLERIGREEYNVWCYDGYEGNFTGWLVPFVEPAYKVRIKDREFPEKTGDYYVIATDVSFSESGGVRKVILGKIMR